MDTQQPVFLDRASRGTRGKRMTKLLDEEIEEDEVFWNQDALNEVENDVEYEEEAEVADVYDSDFDDDEPEADEEVENEPDDRTRTKKKLIFPGKPPTKKKKNKVLSKIEKVPEDEKISEESTPDEQHEVPDDAEEDKIVRKSTRTSVIIRQAERDAIRAALQATTKPIKKKKEGEEKRMTQEEMLLEAAQTEIKNLRNLERVLAREEEVKKRAIVHKQVYSGPKIQYLSRDGSSYLNFVGGSSFQSEISTAPIPFTVIRRLNYLMPLKKHSRSSANGLRKRGAAVRTGGHWWDYCLMQLSNERERDQSFLTIGKRLPFLTLLVSEEFLHSKFKTRTSCDTQIC